MEWIHEASRPSRWISSSKYLGKKKLFEAERLLLWERAIFMILICMFRFTIVDT